MQYHIMPLSTPEGDGEPPRLLQLAAHPLRWRLLRALANGDLIVQELTERVSAPQNLVSYHLAKLRSGGVVSARRSSADRRDTYYTLDLAQFESALSATGRALHPGLETTTKLQVLPARQQRVLFLCTGNSARSQMAQALMRYLSGGKIEATSAGAQPRNLHPLAVSTMREMYGLDISDQKSRAIGTVTDQEFDWIISLCDRMRETCTDFANVSGVTHWSIANPSDEPSAADAPEHFRQMARQLETRIRFFLARLAASSASSTDGGEQTDDETR